MLLKAAEARASDRLTTKRGLCGVCPSGCWVELDMLDGKIEAVRPQRDHPLGTICRRGAFSQEIVYSEHRLRYPMRRVGQKGSLRFARISWDEAFDEIVAQLNRTKEGHGPEAATIFTGRGSF